MLGDPYLAKFVLADDGEAEPPSPLEAAAAAAGSLLSAGLAAATRPPPAPVIRASEAVLDVDAVDVSSAADTARLDASAAADASVAAAAETALAASRDAVAELEQAVGTSVDVWKQRVSAQAAEAAGVSAPQQRVSGAWSGSGLLRGFTALIKDSNVQINNSVTVNIGQPGAPPVAEAKAQLVRSLLGIAGGARATPQQQARTEALCRSLEAATPAAAPLRSPLLGGRWQLQYTTDAALLGTALLRPVASYLTVDVFALMLLREDEYSPLPFLRWTSASVADVLPRSDSRAALRFRGLRVAGLDLPAPPRSPSRAALAAEAAALGDAGEQWIDVTYLDHDLQIQRTSSGAVAVFTRAE